MATTTTKTTAAPATPSLILQFKATKETAGTVRYDMTDESVEKNGGRGTNIYIPKTMINMVGGLAPDIEIHVHKA